MPLPSDEKLIALANDVLAQFGNIFGHHPGFRPAHAKGVLLSGTFTPSPDACSLTRAPHMGRPSTTVTARFSNATGLPLIPDGDPNANPRGLAIRFHLAEHVHTDIVGHSVNGFPVRTGQEFLEFLRAVAGSATSKSSPSPIEMFLGAHPSALEFIEAAKAFPSSFAREAYFGVSALRFVNHDGVARYGRFRIVPEAGVDHLGEESIKSKSANFLFDELSTRVVSGPVRFDVQVQVAEESDAVNDATIHWPANRRIVTLGKLNLTGTVPDDAGRQKQIIFDPIPRVEGIEPSDDPLLELRAAVYLLSGRRRRQAPDSLSTTA
jgi:catalase